MTVSYIEPLYCIREKLGLGNFNGSGSSCLEFDVGLELNKRVSHKFRQLATDSVSIVTIFKGVAAQIQAIGGCIVNFTRKYANQWNTLCHFLWWALINGLI